MKILFQTILLTILLTLGTSSYADTYKLDPVHTQIMFTVSHMGFSNTTGSFVTFDGTFDFNPDDMAASSTDVTIQTASIDMNDTTWNGQLSSDKWFNVEKFPTMTFKGNKITKTGEKTMDVTGNLTLLGVTKPVTLKVIFNKAGDMMGTDKAGFSASVTIDRTEFGMMTFAPAIGTNVEIRIEVEGAKI